MGEVLAGGEAKIVRDPRHRSACRKQLHGPIHAPPHDIAGWGLPDLGTKTGFEPGQGQPGLPGQLTGTDRPVQVVLDEAQYALHAAVDIHARLRRTATGVDQETGDSLRCRQAVAISDGCEYGIESFEDARRSRKDPWQPGQPLRQLARADGIKSEKTAPRRHDLQPAQGSYLLRAIRTVVGFVRAGAKHIAGIEQPITTAGAIDLPTLHQIAQLVGTTMSMPIQPAPSVREAVASAGRDLGQAERSEIMDDEFVAARVHVRIRTVTKSIRRINRQGTIDRRRAAMTPRDLVHATLDFTPGLRAPRHLWVLPGAVWEHPDLIRDLRRDFPDDIVSADGHCREQAPTSGDPYRIGTHVDAWGCTFVNVHDGIIGEVKEPLIRDWADDAQRMRIPRAWLSIDRDAINRDCAATDRFVLAGCCPRPFEQLQFLRGTPELLMDLADPCPAFLACMATMHAFYCELLEAWAATDVDALNMMDDWGSQQSLLISPKTWRRLFKPMYADYAAIAHRAGKRMFMHSDGNIAAIYPDLIEIGIDAVNSQLFCIGLDRLRPFAGRITFWGEMDRQHILPHGSTADVDAAVRQVHAALGQRGGCIAQLEFGPGALPANVLQTFRSWDEVTTA
jgi:uroporphyrinogen decarboxylase